jgi:hypothetical protein
MVTRIFIEGKTVRDRSTRLLLTLFQDDRQEEFFTNGSLVELEYIIRILVAYKNNTDAFRTDLNRADVSAGPPLGTANNSHVASFYWSAR